MSEDIQNLGKGGFCLFDGFAFQLAIRTALTGGAGIGGRLGKILPKITKTTKTSTLERRRGRASGAISLRESKTP